MTFFLYLLLVGLKFQLCQTTGHITSKSCTQDVEKILYAQLPRLLQR